MTTDTTKGAFWSEDFDMDLFKVLPDTREIIAPIAHVPLWTYGHTTNGRLNHPTVWNGNHGMLSFWGTQPNAFKPYQYVCPSKAMIKTNAEDAIRDLWVHPMIMICDGVRVWNSHNLQPYFNSMMYRLRGWGGFGDGKYTDQQCRFVCTASISAAVTNLRREIRRNRRR